MVSTTTNNLNLISKNDFQDMGRYYPLFKTLFENEIYMELRLESKVVYTFFRDRLNLSLKNGWIDENGFVFLMYSNSKLAKMLNCSKSTLLKVKKELLKHGLIYEIRQSNSAKGNLPNRIYLGKLEDDFIQEAPENQSQAVELAAPIPQPTNETISPNTKKRKERKGGWYAKYTRVAQKLSTNDTEYSETEYNTPIDTNRYTKEDEPLATLSHSEAFQMGNHGFLSSRAVKLLSLFGTDAKALEDKIYQAKRKVEKDFSVALFGDTKIYGELWTSDIEGTIERFISKVKIGQQSGHVIKDLFAYFYTSMVHFWKTALFLENSVGFLALQDQNDQLKTSPTGPDSLIKYNLPTPMTEKELDFELTLLGQKPDSVKCFQCTVFQKVRVVLCTQKLLVASLLTCVIKPQGG